MAVVDGRGKVQMVRLGPLSNKPERLRFVAWRMGSCRHKELNRFGMWKVVNHGLQELPPWFFSGGVLYGDADVLAGNELLEPHAGRMVQRRLKRPERMALPLRKLRAKHRGKTIGWNTQGELPRAVAQSNSHFPTHRRMPF